MSEGLLGEMLRGLEHDELYRDVSKGIAKLQWQIIEETDSETGLVRHVLIDEDGNPLWRVDHADKRVAALAIGAFLAGAIQSRNEMQEEKGELVEKLRRSGGLWSAPVGNLN